MGASHISLLLLLLLAAAPQKSEVYTNALSAVLSEALIFLLSEALFCQYNCAHGGEQAAVNQS